MFSVVTLLALITTPEVKGSPKILDISLSLSPTNVHGYHIIYYQATNSLRYILNRELRRPCQPQLQLQGEVLKSLRPTTTTTTTRPLNITEQSFWYSSETF